MRILSSFWNAAAVVPDTPDRPVEPVEEECSLDHQAVVYSVYNHVFEGEDDLEVQDDLEAQDDLEVQAQDQDREAYPVQAQGREASYPVQALSREAYPVRVKPMYYPLVTQTPTETLAQLKQLTQDQYPRFLDETVINYRGKIRFGRLAVPMDPVFYHTLIGAHGYFLQRSCETWDLIAILPIKNELFFWGSRSKVIKAMNVLRHRIQVCGSRLQMDVSAF